MTRIIAVAAAASMLALAGCGSGQVVADTAPPAAPSPTAVVTPTHADLWRTTVLSYKRVQDLGHHADAEGVVSMVAPAGQVFQVVRYRLTNAAKNPQSPASLFDETVNTDKGPVSPSMQDDQRMAVVQDAEGVDVLKSVNPGASIVKTVIVQTQDDAVVESVALDGEDESHTLTVK